MDKAEPVLTGKTVVLGVGGGIAAYKAAELVRLLRKAGAAVHVIMTVAAQRFITPLTLQALSGNRVATDLFDLTQESEIGHIELADRADLLLIAPATADLIGRLAAGLADDVLTAVALACRAPLLLAPAMNSNMWQHPQVQENLRRLVQRGVRTCGPDEGELACGWVGPGRMMDPPILAEEAAALLGRGGGEGAKRGGEGASGDLRGRRVLVTAGPTYEPLDPVRFLGNRSSGKMGFALAAAAARRGAEVSLVAGPVSLPTPTGVRRFDVESAAEMARLVLPAIEGPARADVIIMAAAVADYRAAQVAENKLKKGALGAAPVLALVPTVDILRELGARRQGAVPVLVGFAAETRQVEEYAARKLRDKGCDLIVANDVAEPGSGFGTDTNRVTLIGRPACGDDDEAEGQPLVDRLPLLSKEEVAERVLDRVVGLLVRAEGAGA
jgi:phosphopantothenoylcysteine decarboxylase/phosphopantothenate--cysteine ligase